MDSRINLSKEKEQEMTMLIKEFFLNERDEDLGDLAAAIILDFFKDKLASEFYNQGVYDSYTYMTDKIEDLLGVQIYTRTEVRGEGID